MKITKNSFVIAAALAGLVGGTTVRAQEPSQQTSAFSAGLSADSDDDKKIEKHACKGMNSCKGQGGGSKKEWGKNECKGKGGCATDGSKPKM